MKFTPKTEEEIARSNLPWPAGEYDFEVIEADEIQSRKTGKDMLKLALHVFNREGQRRTVFDYLVDPDGVGASKLRHFAEATSMLRKYETGDLSVSDMIGRAGRCRLTISKDKSGQYPDKNSVADYVPARASSADIDEDVPF